MGLIHVGSLPAWPSPKAPKLVLICPTASTKNNEVFPNTHPLPSSSQPFLVRTKSPTKASRLLSRLRLTSREEPRLPNFLVFGSLSLSPLLPFTTLFLQKSLLFPPASHSRVIRADDFITLIGGLLTKLATDYHLQSNHHQLVRSTFFSPPLSVFHSLFLVVPASTFSWLG